MTEYQKVLLQLLSKSLFNRQVDIKDTDWNEVFKEAEKQTVIQLAFAGLDETSITLEE